MAKTQNEIEQDLYLFFKNSELGMAVKNGVYRADMLPYNSRAEEMVVKFISGVDAQIQTGIMAVNIYIPDLVDSDGVNRPNFVRIGEIQSLLRDTLANNGELEYRLTSDSTTTLSDSSETARHCINARIKFKRLSNE